jgi:lipoyl(octanoyl) transferase
MSLVKDTPRFQARFPQVEDWGLISYTEAFAKQKSYVDELIRGERGETLVFCHHPPVVTLGRGTREEDVFSWSGETVEVNRGGRATYHGPSQVVIYPIIDLGGNTPAYIPKKTKSLHEYMRLLEQACILTLKNYGVQAEGHTQQLQVGDEQACEATGVWIGSQKIASIGIAAKKWVTSHGMALNVFRDESAFIGINPCGFTTQMMTCLQDHTTVRVKRESLQKELASHLIFLLYAP